MLKVAVHMIFNQQTKFSEKKECRYESHFWVMGSNLSAEGSYKKDHSKFVHASNWTCRGKGERTEKLVLKKVRPR